MAASARQARATRQDWIASSRSLSSGPPKAGPVGSSQKRYQLRPKMLAQLEALRLIVGADALAVQGIGPRQHLFVDQAADDLAMLQDERHLARAHFQHGARPLAAGAGIAEAGIEEAGIVHAEFADQRIERHHFRGVIRRYLDRLFRVENIKLAGIENQAAIGPRRYRL